MCRLTAYMGPSITLADLVTRPERSVIRQSFDARERLGGSGGQVYDIGALNADGFGVGWFPESFGSPSPCVYSEVGPAWNNRNLINLAAKIRSGLIFAHVRAAGPGMGICKCSCHPFEFGRYLFMHNGQVAGFRRIRRRILESLQSIAFNYAIENSCSDSALAFAMFIDQLPDACGTAVLPPAKLQEMVQITVAKLCQACEEEGVEGVSLLNFVVSDGENMVATRFFHVSPTAPEHVKLSARAASLYFASGSSFEPEEKRPQRQENEPDTADTSDGDLKSPTEREEEMKGGCSACDGDDELQRYRVMRRDVRDQVVIISSEPLTEMRADWVSIPQNHIVLVTNSGALLMSPLLLPNESSLPPIAVEYAQRNVEAFLSTLERFGLTSSLPTIPLGRSESASFRSLRGIDCDGFIPGEHASPTSGNGSSTLSFLDLQGGRVPSSPPSSVETVPPEHVMKDTHSSPVLAVAIYRNYLFSADGAGAGNLCIWDLNLWECRKVYPSEGGGVLSMTCCSVNKMLFITCTDNIIYTWMIETEPSIRLKPGYRILIPDVGHVISLAFNCSSNTLLLGTQDCCLRSIKTPSKWKKNELFFIELILDPQEQNDGQDQNDEVRRAQEILVNPARFPAFRLITEKKPLLSPLRERRRHTSHLGYVHAVITISDKVVSGGGDGLVKLWNSENQLIGCLTGHKAAVLCLCSSSVSIFSGSADETVRVWDIDSSACRRVLNCGASVLCISLVSSVKPILVCGLADESLCVWSLRTFQQLHRFKNQYGQVFAISNPLSDENDNDSVYSRTFRSRNVIACGTSSGSIVSWNIGPMKRSIVRHRTSLSLVSSQMGNEERLLHIEQNLDTVAVHSDFDDVLIESLREMVSIRSISSDSTYVEECWFCAKFLARLLEKYGCSDVKMAFDESHNQKAAHSNLPVVLATLKANRRVPEGKESQEFPTIVFYGHYDVVEAVASSWETDPWEMCGKNGYLYGRGCTDNKGPLLACFFAAVSLHATEELACNVTFIFEGQEECGVSLSERGFDNVINANKSYFVNTAGVVISNNYWIDDRSPCLTYGMRGVIDLVVNVEGPARDLHAGVHGGCVFETVDDLLAVLKSLTNDDGSIAVPHLTEDVRDLSARDIENLQKIKLDLQAYTSEVGTPCLRSNDPLQVLKSRWSQPSLSISNITTSNVANHFRRIPAKVSSLLSLHFVPDQDPAKIEEAVRQHLQAEFAKRKSGNSLKIKVRQISSWWLGETDGKLFRVAHDAIKSVWKVDPLYVREGGSYGGISAFLEQSLAPVLHLPMGQATDNAHLPNERISVRNLLQGKLVVQEFLSRFATSN